MCGLKLCMYMDGWGVSHSLYGTVFKEYIYFFSAYFKFDDL